MAEIPLHVCCFCAAPIDPSDRGAVELALRNLWREGDAPVQALFAHSDCIGGRLHASFPFDADNLAGQAGSDGAAPGRWSCGRITVREVAEVEGIWAEMPVSIDVGKSIAAAKPYEIRHLLIEEDGLPSRRVDLYRQSGEYWSCIDVSVWGESLVVGFGQKVFLLNESRPEPRFVDLGYYFCGLKTGGDWLLAATGEGIARIDAEARIVWHRTDLGLDGVMIDDVAEGIVRGSGEWDPPGGWRDFRLSLDDGRDASAG